jgi:hypothetical protein
MQKMYKISENDTYKGVVFETNDYSKFKHLEGNRTVTEARKAKIRRSVDANGQVFTVITCNERMQVIDGQGRLEVFKEKGLPVNYVIIPGLTAKDCAVLNAATTIWKLPDYINMYCELGDISYRRLRALMEIHKNLSTNSILFAISGNVTSHSGSAYESTGAITLIKNGEFKMDNATAENADIKLQYAERFLPGFKTTGRKELVINGAVWCYDIVPDRERLVERWNKYSCLKSIERPAASMADVMKTLEACYNYRTAAKDSFYIATEYEKWAKSRAR